MRPPAGLIRAVVAAGLLGLSVAAAAQLTLEQAIALARSQDPWLEGSRRRVARPRAITQCCQSADRQSCLQAGADDAV